MSYRSFLVVAAALSIIAAAFIELNAEPFGRIFWHLLTVHDLPASLLMTVSLLAFAFCSRWGDGVGARAEAFVLAFERCRYWVAVILWGSLCLGSVWVYHNHPLSMDEYAALFQAKIFAAGQLHGEFPPELIDNLVPRGFQNHFLMVNRGSGAVWSAYSPGFSLLLAPFVWLGAPWACNPTIAAASFLLVGRITRDLSGSSLAVGWALLFSIASPAFIANGISYYSMPAHLLLNLGFSYLLLEPSRNRLVLGGLCGGFALLLHNPFPHFVFALPWLLWLSSRRGERLRNLGWLIAGYAPVLLLLGAGWSMWQQHALLIGTPINPVDPMAATAGGLDFSASVSRFLRGVSRWVQWPDEFVVERRIGGLIKLWLWASPLLLLLAWFGGRTASDTRLHLLCASGLVTFFSYFLIPFDQGHGWGYRYFHSAWGVLPIFAALGVIKLNKSDHGRSQFQLLLLTLFSLVFANALRLWQIDSFVSDHLAQIPPHAEMKGQIVLHNGRGYYASDLIQNDPWLRGERVILLVTGRLDRERLLSRLAAKGTVDSNEFGDTIVPAYDVRQALRSGGRGS